VLVVILQRQDRFSTTNAASMAVKIVPTLFSSVPNPSRLWLTSLLRRGGPMPRKLLIVWRNDDPAAVPEGIQVIELFSSDNDEYETINWSTKSWWHHKGSRFQLWRQRQKILKAAREIQRRPVEPHV
jgi:hypothetical protein